MDLKLDFDATEVAEQLKNAIMSSTFKELFTKAAEKEIGELTKGSGSYTADAAMRSLVKEFIKQQLRDLLYTEYKETIQAALRKELEDTEKLKEIASDVIGHLQFKNSY